MGGALRRPDAQGLYGAEAFTELAEALAGYTPRQDCSHPYWAGHAPCSMHIEEVEAIWAPIAERDDWSALYAKVEAIRAMGDALRG